MMMRSTVTGSLQTPKRHLTDDVFHCHRIITTSVNTLLTVDVFHCHRIITDSINTLLTDDAFHCHRIIADSVKTINDAFHCHRIIADSVKTINDVFHCHRIIADSVKTINDTFLCHRSLTDSENTLGMVVSRQPLSRSNPYFEVECLGETKPTETGLVLGVMHDILMSDRFPMESKERSGGAVDGWVGNRWVGREQMGG